MAKATIKTYTQGTETLFSRSGAVVKDLKKNTSKTYKSINAAKRFCRQIVDANGLRSVAVSK